jgi:outer membrane receptor protein involved in Fe transport
MHAWNRHRGGAALLATLGLASVAAAAQPGPDDEPLDELVVTSQRREQPVLLHAGNIGKLDAETIDRVRHQHVHELLGRVSGVWITRASGQEHLTAIRSPVLTGAGSCGAFLFLEDGIPLRPAGFCNVNGLFEANSEIARSVEVLRGPGNALYGSNALHGIVNILLPEPGLSHAPSVALEGGSNDYYRVSANLPFSSASPWLASLVLADDGGFRDDSGYRQGKLHLKHAWELTEGSFTLGISATDLDQETAGFILGEDAYKDPALNRENLNPEAFREAASQRVYGIWRRDLAGAELDVRPYLRHSDMRFLQHFLPGQPLEENGHVSAGTLVAATFAGPARTTIVGVDLEWADLYLKETQDGPTEGSDFLVETRPEGKHYDYSVTSLGVAPYVQVDWALGERLAVGAGLRTEYLRYDYDNRMLTGNTRDDGTACGFGGCLYSRPADRSDSYTNLAPKLSLSYRIDRATSLYANLARGFRAPQATELYRLQSGQQVADLDSERIDSLEAGLRIGRAGWSLDVAVFTANKRNSIFRDAEGFNVSGARSTHRGVEASLGLGLGSAWSLAVEATYARHEYDFDVVAARGETFASGRDVDTAPRLLGSVELLYRPGPRFDASLQLATIGEYYLDAENRFTYPGHSVANLRTGISLGETLGLALRINNLADRAIADRADYAFGNYRYFPGRGREFFAEILYTPKESL